MSDTSRDLDLAEVIYNIAVTAAYEAFGTRVTTLEEEIAELRDELQKPPTGLHSVKA